MKSGFIRKRLPEIEEYTEQNPAASATGFYFVNMRVKGHRSIERTRKRIPAQSSVEGTRSNEVYSFRTASILPSSYSLISSNPKER